ncbi:MAG TPA: LysE family translocator [Thiothrix sp.]|nr:LysE family translocator [Thiothrix sp.]
MNIIEIMTLFGIMVVLSAIPSTSVALVVTRSATLGVANGFSVVIGIVLGDLIFVMLAILGLSAVAETMGGLFSVIKYAGAAYLLWFGFSLLKSQSNTIINVNLGEKRSLLTSFLAGIILTLGDIKAIFFYVSLFPIFVDLSALKTIEILTIIGITIMSVGGIKMLYAVSAIKALNVARKLKFESTARKIAGGTMIGAGSYLLIKV